ncbi:MAG: DUF4240 domain-containing protein [Chloroflexota bacterium]
MNEAAFWEIIKESLAHTKVGADEQYEWIYQKLTILTVEEIIEFENQLNSLKSKACRFSILMANFVIQSYISDDGFENFRLWLIANGEISFYQALKDPDKIADFCQIHNPIEEITGEGLLFVAEKAYQQVTGEGDFFERVEVISEPKIVENWPDDIEGFQMKMPNLFSTYWNQKQVEEFYRLSRP